MGISTTSTDNSARCPPEDLELNLTSCSFLASCTDVDDKLNRRNVCVIQGIPASST